MFYASVLHDWLVDIKSWSVDQGYECYKAIYKSRSLDYKQGLTSKRKECDWGHERVKE